MCKGAQAQILSYQSKCEYKSSKLGGYFGGETDHPKLGGKGPQLA